MNDVKMMLGKRAGEYYLFVTWCIASPILLIVSEIFRKKKNGKSELNIGR